MTAPTVDDTTISAASRRNRTALDQLRKAFDDTADAARDLLADITDPERDE